MTLSSSDLPETQVDRTLLAWRRTMIGVLTVAGIGSLHFLTTARPAAAAICGTVALISLAPILARLASLRAGRTAAPGWEAAALTACLLLLAAAVLGAGR